MVSKFGGVSINIQHLNKPISSMLIYKKGGGRIPPISLKVISPAIPLPTCQVVMSPKGYEMPRVAPFKGNNLKSINSHHFQPPTSNQNSSKLMFKSKQIATLILVQI